MSIRPDKQAIIVESIDEINQSFSDMGFTIEEAEAILQGASRFLQQVRYAASNPILVPSMKTIDKETEKEITKEEDIQLIDKQEKTNG